MVLSRRGLMAVGGLPLAAPAALAQSWPSRPVRIIVPYTAGGTDQIIRALQDRMAQMLGQAVIIDSVGGGGGALGSLRVRNAPADGYTLLFAGTGALTAVPRLQRLNYSIADFRPIANLVTIPYVLAARRDAAFSDMAGFLNAARAKPEALTYGTPGVGSTPHLITAALSRAASIRMLHVPYSGGGPAAVALLAGDIDLAVAGPSIMALRDRGVRPLAQTGGTRTALLPELPTLREAGLPVELSTRFGLFAPRNTDDAIIERLSQMILICGADPAYVANMHRGFNQVDLLDRPQFQESVEAEDRATADWLQVLDLS